MPGNHAYASLMCTVLGSIFEVFFMCFMGWMLSRKHVLDKTTVKKVNLINVWLFTPCLLFANVAFSLTPESLKELWIIPLWFVIVSIVSGAVSWFMATTLGLTKSQRNFCVAAAMFNSTDSLPIALMQSLVLTVSDLKWTSDDTTEAMIGRGFGYMVLYATFENMGRWSYGIHLLSQVDDDTYPPHTARDAEQVNLAGVVPRQLPNTLSVSPSSSSDEWGDSTLPYRRVVTPPTSSKWHSRIRRATHALWTSLSKINKFMTVPMYAALSAFVVALIPPLQYVLKEEVPPVKGFLTSTGACTIPITLLTLGAYFHDEPPLKKLPSSGELSTSPTLTCDDRVGDGPRIFESHTESSDRSWLRSQEDEYLEGGHESLSQVGRGATVTTRSTGLWKNALGQRFGGIGREMLGRKRQPGESTSVIVSCLARMVITPSILLPVMAVLSSYNAHALFEDPVFVLSIILITSSPPALALVQMIQVASGEAFEILLRQTFFWAYCVLTPPLTLFYTVIGLYLVRP